MANINEMSMGEWKKRMRDDTDPRLVQPAIPATANFELKGHILSQLRDIPSYGKDNEDAYKHLDEVNDIADYLNTPNVPRYTVLLRMLPVTFKGAVKEWLKSLPPGSITTWAKMRKDFIDQFCPPSKISKLKKAIANFEQQPGESLYEAWERYKSLLRNCPHNDLNSQQEVSIFYDGVNVTTKHLLDSQGPLTKKASATVKELIEEFSKHTREYHKPRKDVTRGLANAASEDMSVVLAMLHNMDRRMTKMDKTIHAIRVDDNGNRKVQAFHSSGDRFDEDWRKPKKKWLPYDEYKRPLQKKRHEGTKAAIKEHQELMKGQKMMMKEQQEMMRNTQALVRNQQASILTIEKQLGQLASKLNERSSCGLSGNTEQNPRGATFKPSPQEAGK
ncbi:uncharacterized protein LOC128127960 [Lactuca sativa]|uniref:uncharacterized protein LOC111915546 n=1 Tax=Lactuca sativa TaxID=4236 RepID=UPI000CD8B2FF|nr:uncharacterized protein LOC111915546 [Lactuca sativa]XP_052622670.1 uncharacterized protein LOC128127960 [Lactuca sativa]